MNEVRAGGEEREAEEAVRVAEEGGEEGERWKCGLLGRVSRLWRHPWSATSHRYYRHRRNAWAAEDMLAMPLLGLRVQSEQSPCQSFRYWNCCHVASGSVLIPCSSTTATSAPALSTTVTVTATATATAAI